MSSHMAWNYGIEGGDGGREEGRCWRLAEGGVKETVPGLNEGGGWVE